MAKQTYYFSHDANARSDEKILMLRADYGWEGYGIYWLLIEMMFENEDTCLYRKNIKGIAVANNINRDKLDGIVETCINEGLFKSDEEKFYSPSLLRRKKKYQELLRKRSEGGKKGMSKRWGDNKSDISKLKDSNNGDITHYNKGKEIKLKRKEKKKDKETKEEVEERELFVKWFMDNYKGKKVKKARDTKLPKIIKDVGVDELKRAVERYAKETKDKEQQFIKHESTWWNGGYIDYLDDNYEELKTDQPKKRHKADKPIDTNVDWFEEYEKGK